MRISVIGCGYLGAVHAACMAKLGHDVVGIDVDEGKVAQLSGGQAPFYEPGLDDLLSELEESGRLRFTTDMAAAAGSEVHFICVGTPQKKGENAADMTLRRRRRRRLCRLPSARRRGRRQVHGAGGHGGAACRTGPRTPSPVRTLVWNPEFLREGHAVTDTLHPDRFVYGVPDGSEDHPAVAVLDEVYARAAGHRHAAAGDGLRHRGTGQEPPPTRSWPPRSPSSTPWPRCARPPVPTSPGWPTRSALDDRIGRKFLNAGIGFGGGCLPKDIRAFMARAGELGADQALTFLREVDAINMRRRTRVVELTRELCGGILLGQRIAVLGAAFKPDSDDVRDSPALSVAAQLQLQGAVVTVTDPQALANAAKRFPELQMEPDLEATLHKADAVLLLTEWKAYRELDPHVTKALVSAPRILDGRNVLDPAKWRAAGWTYKGLGRP